jgi:hypothetical protein
MPRRLMAAALTAIILGGVALSTYSCKIPTMLKLEIRTFIPSRSLKLDFERQELWCYDEDHEGSMLVNLNVEDTEGYREYAMGFFIKVYDERGEYTSTFSLEATETIWTLTATYYDGSKLRIFAEHGYPDDWDEFLERTNALVGFEYLKRYDEDFAP